MDSPPAGNHYDKYHSKNPVARWLMGGFLRAFDDLVMHTRARSAFEVGCGEGELMIRLAKLGLAVGGCDISPEIVSVARGRLADARVEAPLRATSIHDLAPADAAELVVCCEVLEHVDEAERAVERLAKIARPYLIASVPREPLWRVLNVARGSYVASLGNTPGHVNHWSRRAFLRLLERRFEILETRAPTPWTMTLCRSRR